MIDEMIFERFLDNLEIYTDLRNSYKRDYQQLQVSGKNHDDIEMILTPNQDAIHSQRIILMNIFSTMIEGTYGPV